MAASGLELLTNPKLVQDAKAELDGYIARLQTKALRSWSRKSPSPGEHTLVSRVTDATGKVQPTAQDNESKKSFLEENSQSPRKVMIS